MKMLRNLLLILIQLAGATFADGPSYKLRNEYPEGGNTAFSYGIATAIDPTTLLTAKHLIHKSKSEKIFIRTDNGWMQCDFVKDATDGSDLCELHCRVALKGFAKLDVVNPVKGEQAEIQGGNKTDLRRWPATVVDAKTALCPEYSHGSSGGPLVADLKVIGVTTAMYADVHGGANGKVKVVPCEAIKHAFDDEPINPAAPSPLAGVKAPRSNREGHPASIEDDTYAGEIIPPPKDYTPAVKRLEANGIQWPGGKNVVLACKTCQRAIGHVIDAVERAPYHQRKNQDVVDYDCDWRGGQ